MKEQNKRSSQDRTQNELDTSNRSHGEGTPVYLTSNSTLQSPEEHAHDKSIDPSEDTSMDVSNDDLQDSKAGKLTGRENNNE